jgi:hypothetical protein
MTVRALKGLTACMLFAGLLSASSANAQGPMQRSSYPGMQPAPAFAGHQYGRVMQTGWHTGQSATASPSGTMYGSGYCQPSCGHGWAPTHYHTFEYRQPKNLVYPPANQPAAVVQYPYYTVKGPSCFFYK